MSVGRKRLRLSFVRAMAPARSRRSTLEIVILVVGVALLAGALAASQPWLDRHFLPSFLVPRQTYVRIETSVRLAFALLGIFLMAVARPAAARLTAGTLGIAAAIVMALGAGE